MNYKTTKMKEPKIKAVREAFSMQPETWEVCRKEMDFHKYTPDEVHKHTKNCIEKINVKQVGPFEFVYEAINYNEQKIAQFETKSVNVFFFTEEEEK